MDFREKYREEISKAADEFVYYMQVSERQNESSVDIVQNLYAFVDKANKMSGLNDKVSCSKGCYFCCHDEIMIGAIEVENILLAAEHLDLDLELLKKQYNSDFKELKWNDKRCALLNTDNECSIYENRPMICRTHNSTDAKELCLMDGEPKYHGQLHAIEIEGALLATFVHKESALSLSDVLLNR